MRRMLMAILAMLASTAALRALDEPPETAKTPRERYQALSQEHRKAMQEFMEAYQKAKSQEERGKLFQEKYPQPQSYVDRFLAIAESAPEDPAAVDALVWVVQNGGSGPAVTRAIDRLAARHAEDRRMGDVAPMLVYSPSPAAEQLLRAIAEKNPDRAAKGRACLALGQYLKQQAETIRTLKQDPKRAQQVEAYYERQGLAKDEVARLARRDPDALSQEAEAMFERTVSEFGDVSGGRDTLGKTARSELYEIRNLGIGKPAPEIAGEDIDGQPMKLSDYKGKVVVVDFWGDW